MTAGPLYKVTQTVQLCGNEMLNRKMKLFAGRPGECSMIALRPQEMPDRRDWIAMRCEELQAEKADLPTHLSSPPNSTKLLFEFSDNVRNPNTGIIIILIREITSRSDYLIACRPNHPPTLRTDGRRDI